MGLFGLSVLTFCNIYARRVIKKLYVHKSGQMARIQFFSAFGKPKIQEFSVRDFNQLMPSYSSFYKAELTSIGNIWISLPDNEYRSNELYHELAINLLDGQELPMVAENALKNKIKKKMTKNRRY